ncbi:MAG TPA: hypothetical protein VHX92_09480 [Rhizomicrobium sp.]|jgi:hypothetical protein|nr:hypothetical protein [Rhizomicrobium sp.]
MHDPLWGWNVALRIEYFANGEKVMVVTCLKWLEDAKADALEGLALYKADIARVIDIDMEIGGTVLAVVKR